MRDERNIVLFDGFCNFCSGSVQFIIRRDPAGRFRFAASQSEVGKKILEKHEIGELASHSIILLRDNRIYKKSDAALYIVRELKGAWPLLYVFHILPTIVRDYFYDLVGRNRYRFYGSRENCFIPDAGIKDRFLDEV